MIANLTNFAIMRSEDNQARKNIMQKATSRVGPIVRAISQACVLVCILSFTSGCREYSKEQQREIDAIKRRVTENPASIDHDDGHGTPLEVATLNGYLDLAQWLVSHRADVNAPDHDEGTVLHYAAVVDHSPKLDILRFFLSKGANVDARRKGTETPLHVAVFLGRADVVTVLLEHGADVHARGYFGQTPMHLSSFPQGYPEIIKILLAHGANINERQNNQATPLRLAAMGGNAAIVALLLDRGADFRLADATGATPLHYAAQSGNRDAASLLLTHGADPNARDFDAHTPLWRALNQPAITAGPGFSGPVDTRGAVEALYSHGGRK
jgi:ankyrin repeat protein